MEPDPKYMHVTLPFVNEMIENNNNVWTTHAQGVDTVYI